MCGFFLLKNCLAKKKSINQIDLKIQEKETGYSFFCVKPKYLYIQLEFYLFHVVVVVLPIYFDVSHFGHHHIHIHIQLSSDRFNWMMMIDLHSNKQESEINEERKNVSID